MFLSKKIQILHAISEIFVPMGGGTFIMGVQISRDRCSGSYPLYICYCLQSN